VSALTADLVAALAAESAAAPPLAAWTDPVIIQDDGYAQVPDPECPGKKCGVYVHPGLRLGWRPFPPLGGILLSVWGGPRAEEGWLEEGVTAFMTLPGFKRFVADLQSIADQLDGGAE